ncbi:hypothetical protein WT01_23400 [Burkholderia cepacia]|nr:hypothetical protein WT01_23400 [Burkholderia cepacia]
MVLSIVSVQLGSALATRFFATLGPAGTAFVTALFSAAMLSVLAPPHFHDVGVRQSGVAVMLGATLAAMELPFFLSLQYLPLGIASTITFLGPLAVSLLASREKSHYVSAVLAIVGITLLAPAANGNLAPLGLGLAMTSAVAWAGFAPVSKRANSVFHGNSGLTVGMWIAAAILFPVAIAEGRITHARPVEIASVVCVSFLGSVCPVALEYRALRAMSVRAYGILLSLEPAVAVVVGAIFLSQEIGMQAWLAVACITAAALVVTLTQRSDG